jgi:hypothetical protein
MSLLDHARTLFKNGREIMRAKNTDYSGASSDPFSNFRAAKVLGIQPEVGLMMRVMDKSKRIQSFIANGKMAVVSEPVDDAIADKLNYYVLLTGLLAERFSGVYFPCPSRGQLMQLHERMEGEALKGLIEADYDAMLLEASVDGVHPLLGELRSIRQGFSSLSAILSRPDVLAATEPLPGFAVPDEAIEYYDRTIREPVLEILHRGLRSVVLMHYHVTKQREEAAAAAASEAASIAALNAFAKVTPIPVSDVFVGGPLASDSPTPPVPPVPPVVPPAGL